MEGNETTNASELIPGREYQLGVIDCHAQVFYNQQTWVVVYHGFDHDDRIPVTQIANGSYYSNCRTLPSETPVMFLKAYSKGIL
jgi:hypothetical protein